MTAYQVSAARAVVDRRSSHNTCALLATSVDIGNEKVFSYDESYPFEHFYHGILEPKTKIKLEVFIYEHISIKHIYVPNARHYNSLLNINLIRWEALELVCCKKRQKIVPDQLLICD